MVLSLWLPIVLASIAVFFASFLSWMIVQLHKQDWKKIAREDDFMQAVRDCGLVTGSYTFPACEGQEQMKSPEFQTKLAAGPCGIVTIFSKVNMGKNLALTFLYFLAVNFCLAYLTTLAFPIELRPNPGFMEIFRFVFTAGFIAYLSAIIAHSIWFRCRVVGHIIESIAFAAIVGALYAGMWPST